MHFRELDKSKIEAAPEGLNEFLEDCQTRVVGQKQTHEATSETEETKSLDTPEFNVHGVTPEMVVLEQEWEDFYKKAREGPTPLDTTPEIWLKMQKGNFNLIKLTKSL